MRVFPGKIIFFRIITSIIFIGAITSCGGKSVEGNTDVVNYDIDGDGLIELHSLEDLNDIRNYSGGPMTLYGKDTGCPDTGCRGYELAQDLDFDTNQDGQLGPGDTYWNEGMGWIPIDLPLDNSLPGGEPRIFHLEGNGFAINNFFYHRPKGTGGLFFFLDNAHLSDLHFRGELASITGGGSVGAIAGIFSNSTLIRCSSTVDVQALSFGGGLIGSARDVEVKESFFKGKVSVKNQYAGGLIGTTRNVRITASFVMGSVLAGNNYAGGLTAGDNSGVPEGNIVNSFSAGKVWAAEGYAAGLAPNPKSIENSYSVALIDGKEPRGGLTNIDEKQSSNSYWLEGVVAESGGTGIAANWNALTCWAENGQNRNCSDENLFGSWLDSNNSDDQPLWDFGLSGQLPGLVIQNQVFRPQNPF